MKNKMGPEVFVYLPSSMFQVGTKKMELTNLSVKKILSLHAFVTRKAHTEIETKIQVMYPKLSMHMYSARSCWFF